MEHPGVLGGGTEKGTGSMMLATAVRERPIIFSGEMVRAILDGRKTQTRRVMQPQPSYHYGAEYPPSWGRGIRKVGWANGGPDNWHPEWLEGCPFGQPGDRLWVRESAWYRDKERADDGNIVAAYDADIDDEVTHVLGWDFHPSIHMPRWASRLTLEITELRVQRVQEITHEDGEAEGFTAGRYDDEGRQLAWGRGGFSGYWDTLNAKRGYSWESNPWVWAITFRKVEP